MLLSNKKLKTMVVLLLIFSAPVYATRFLPETCSWHQERCYNEQRCIEDAQVLEDEIRARYKNTLICASIINIANANNLILTFTSWKKLEYLVLSDATMSMCYPLYRQVQVLSDSIIDLENMIKRIDWYKLDGARDKPWQRAWKMRLKSLRLSLLVVDYGMVATAQYQEESDLIRRVN